MQIRVIRGKKIYKFNGKERDAETGLYYYGARYYEPELAMWYGVDALAEKYPNMGGYVYCAGNPVKLVDVDGNSFTEAAEKIINKLKDYVAAKVEAQKTSLQANIAEWTTQKNSNQDSKRKIKRLDRKIERAEKKNK